MSVPAIGGTQEMIHERQRTLGTRDAINAKLIWATSTTRDCPDATRAAFRSEKP